MSDFISLCLRGQVLLDEIDDFVDEWHENDHEETLCQFLGMTDREYTLWLSDAEVLPYILRARKENRDVGELIQELEALPLAARSDGLNLAPRLLEWLKSEGHWD